MNAKTLAELRAGHVAMSIERKAEEEKLEQVRELLFGEVHRSGEARLARLEARLDGLEHALDARIDALQARVDALLAGETGSRRRAIEEIAGGIAELGERLRRATRD